MPPGRPRLSCRGQHRLRSRDSLGATAMLCGAVAADRHRAECRPGTALAASHDRQPLPSANGLPANVRRGPAGYRAHRAQHGTKCPRPGPTRRFRHPTEFRPVRLAHRRQCTKAGRWLGPAPNRLPPRRAMAGRGPRQNFLARSCRSKRAPVMLVRRAPTQKHDPKTPVESMGASVRQSWCTRQNGNVAKSLSFCQKSVGR
ncbi:MAG: hypothetical protein OJF62_001925 [Pseudolabrys sp.]|nr:hypothetical protein [Pseudolabrys sp.]